MYYINFFEELNCVFDLDEKIRMKVDEDIKRKPVYKLREAMCTSNPSLLSDKILGSSVE